MKVIQKKQKDGVVTLEATATVEEVEKALNACLINFAQTLGLRPTPDKTVQQAITEKMGVQDPDSLVMQQAIEYLAPFALDKMDITPAFPPKPIQKSKLVRKHPFLFELEVTLKIPYELTSYEPVELKLKPMQVDAAEVDRQIQDLADRYPSYVATDPHPVRNGDSVLLQLECKENGKVLEALTTDARTYTTGQGLMPEGFDEHIIGMEVGETKEFTFEGPDVDDQGNETTTTVECKATVVEIQKAVTPTIDDEWIATNMPMYKDLATFKNMISNQLAKAHEIDYENYKRNEAAMAVSERFEGKIPDGCYEAMMENIMSNIQASIASQPDMTYEKFVEQNGGEQQFKMMVMMQARQTLVQGFSLDAVYRHEGLVASEEDVNDACIAINPQNPKRVRQQMEETGNGFFLREAAERIRAGKFLVDHAKITFEEPESVVESMKHNNEPSA